jgi:hypothetical protein
VLTKTNVHSIISGVQSIHHLHFIRV